MKPNLQFTLNLKIILTMLSLMFASVEAQAKPNEIALQKKTLTETQKRQICQKLTEECKTQIDWRWYKAKNQTQYYLISKLKMFQFDPQLQLSHQWDLATYQPRTQRARWAMDQENENEDSLYIFPKLYPINEQDYAVAVLQTWSEGYSGGGMSEEVADIIHLKADNTVEKVFENIPFSMSRMIRACFSERDYESSHGKCHDEYNLSSWIQYQKPMDWKVKYQYDIDLSNASDSNEKSGKYTQIYSLSKVGQTIELPRKWTGE